MPIFSGKKKYKRKGLKDKIKSQISNIKSKRGAAQIGTGVAVAGDVLLNKARVVKAPIKLAAWGAGKTVQGLGKARAGLGRAKKAATDLYNKGRYGSGKPIKVDKTLRLEAGKKPLGLPAKGSIPNVIIPEAPVRTGPVKRGQGGSIPKNPIRVFRGPDKNRIVSNKLPGWGINTKVPNNPFNTTVLKKGPGTASGTFKIPKEGRIIDSRINKVTDSARKRAKNVIKKGQALAKQYGNFQARDKAAKKAKDIISRGRTKATKIATEISKHTGKSVAYVKAVNKKLSTPAGKAALNAAYKRSAKRVAASAVALAPVPGARVASVAMHTAITASTAKDVVNIAKAVKSSSGKKKSSSKTKRVKF